MFDIESFCKRFKFGDIEDIFINIYSFFIIGYLILFSVYEKNFINLQLHTQILLSLAISLPVTSLTNIIGLFTIATEENILKAFRKKYNKNNEEENDKIEDKIKDEEKEGFFYSTINISFLSSIFYSILFSLFYIVKHLKIIEYNSDFDPVIAVVIVVFTLLSLLLLALVKIFITVMKKYEDLKAIMSINRDAPDLSDSEIRGP
jgi:hypothetical protein